MKGIFPSAGLSKLKPFPVPGVIVASLPGPTRKREPSSYCYQLSYRNPHPHESGCVLLWDVQGGRQEYQIALERETTGQLRWHCTCADAVYRGEDAPHLCKHVRGLCCKFRYSFRQIEHGSDTK